MKRGATLDEPTGAGPAAAAERVRCKLQEAGVFAVNVVGGPGCGKSTLINTTVDRLPPDVRVGVITGDLCTHRDELCVARRNGQVVQVKAADASCLDATQIEAALDRLDLKKIDLLFVENVGSLTVGRDGLVLGQSATVTVFSVAGGDDKARKHPALVEAADAVILNKIDLLFAVPFDLAGFRADVRQTNPSAELIEIGALSARGTGAWFDWLVRGVNRQCQCHEASHWFG